ncbi:TolB-like translocation protein [Streptomyces justiciae]|uniref:PD40 domain-containing protein n=1 Tax=Streptomyces justiciae TaxID=2780140 RepID=UPI001881CC9D|nr:PD40 domain-containing protein [Streptomyces justiciae]MBE8474362.1 PD40 domain-containing protein [Streptomyces justiciae]
MARTERGTGRRRALRAAGGGALVALLTAATLPTADAAPAPASSTLRISVAADGTEANGPSSQPAISADGRVVAFVSHATNLVPGDPDDGADLFVRDLRTGTLQRVAADGDIYFPALSANGRYVAYATQNGAESTVYVRDLRTGRTERADVGLDPGHTGGQTPALSADGRTVAFAAYGTDPEGVSRAVYVRDLRAHRTERISPDAGPGHSFRAPSLSADGRKVAYQDITGTPPRGDYSDLYVHDRRTGGTVQADTTHDGSSADKAATAPLLSADGFTLAFTSGASNLVPGADPNSSFNPFVRDLRTGTLTRVDATVPGPEGVLSADAISADGTKLLLDVWAVLTTEDAAHIRDLRTGTDVLVTPNQDGDPGHAVDARMDARARTVAFSGFDDERFVPGDTNGVQDVFVRKVGPVASPQ